MHISIKGSFCAFVIDGAEIHNDCVFFRYPKSRMNNVSGKDKLRQAILNVAISHVNTRWHQPIMTSREKPQHQRVLYVQIMTRFCMNSLRLMQSWIQITVCSFCNIIYPFSTLLSSLLFQNPIDVHWREAKKQKIIVTCCHTDTTPKQHNKNVFCC